MRFLQWDERGCADDRCADVWMNDVQMNRCEDVKMKGCADERRGGVIKRGSFLTFEF